MWLEHLLFGVCFDTELFGEYEVHVSLVCIDQSFLYITGSASESAESSLTILRKDNEVKLEEEIN